MKKLGILIHQISNSQQYTTIARNLNILCRERPDVDSVVFHNDLANVNQPNQFALMQSVEALDYEGVLIATDGISAHLLPSCMCAKEKYLYVWNTDWNLAQRPASFMRDIYMCEDTELIARSEDHAKLISRVFRKPKYVIEEFDYEQLIQKII